MQAKSAHWWILALASSVIGGCSSFASDGPDDGMKEVEVAKGDSDAEEIEEGLEEEVGESSEVLLKSTEDPVAPVIKDRGLPMRASKSAPPMLVSFTPDGEDLSLTTEVAATFAFDMDPDTLSTSTFSVGGVAGTVDYEPENRTATFSPTLQLSPDTSYTAELSSDIKTEQGLSFPGWSWTFKTASR